MYLSNIEVLNFRNYDSINCAFSKEINLIHGPNGSGKTNFLEAIHFSLTGKSFRTKNDFNLIKSGKDFTKTDVKYLKDGQKKNIKILSSLQNGKEITINSVRREKSVSLFYETNLIIFSPSSTQIVRGEPSLKRRFLDRICLKINKEFVLILSRYNQTLKNRNAILKHHKVDLKNRNLIDLLTKELIDLGKIIQTERKNLVEKLNEETIKVTSNEYFELFSNIKLIYKPTDLSSPKITAVFNEEIRRGITLIGAHLDDLIIDDKDLLVKDYSSDGEQKLVTIILKLCELNIIENETRNSSILLLDDLFSELDSKNSFNVISYLKDKSQIFLTSLEPMNLENMKTFQLESHKDNLCIS
jgi:DNA replication and repair protein RecF